MPKIKFTKTAWILSKLKSKPIDKVLKMYPQFMRAYPGTSKTSFEVSVRREARNCGSVEDIKKEEESRLQKAIEFERRQYADRYSRCAKTHRRIPTKKELADIGLNIKRINALFEVDASEYVKDEVPHSVDLLEALARHLYPNRFKHVVDMRIWSTKRLRSLQSKIKKNKRFVISTIVGGCPIHKDFYDTLKYYCKVNNAMLLFIVADNDLAAIPEDMRDEDIVFADVKLNSNLYVSSIKILPKMIEPTTGLDRIGGKTGSFIFGSPKQRLRLVPVHGGQMIPHCIMTTGSVTLPHYIGAKYYQKRTDYLAEQDHILGAIVVEIENSKYFHFRQIQTDYNGGFVDLAKFYTPEGKTTPMYAESFVMGDWHCRDTDPQVISCWKEVTKETKPKSVVIHDGFNGESINHHVKDQAIKKAIRAEMKNDNLREELEYYAKDLNYLSEQYEKLYIVWGNHENFIKKYLNAGRYVDDPQNHLISLDLAKQVILGNNPIEWFIAPLLKHPEKFVWMGEDDDVKIAGIKISDHGHLGANGAKKAPLAAMEKYAQRAIYAHSHTPEILHEAWRVGTSTHLRLNYTKGPGSWLNSSILIYPGGFRQMINSINGKYRP